MMGDHRSVMEAYLSATYTSNLTMRNNAMGDADRLIAAGLSCIDRDLDPHERVRRSLAMQAFRLQGSGGMTGARGLAERLGGLLVRRSMRGRTRMVSPSVRLVEARDIALLVLRWRQHNTCPACLGRGHPTIGEGREVIDDTRVCGECHGTGRIPLHRLVRREHADLALWLASEIDSMVGFAEVKARSLLSQAA